MPMNPEIKAAWLDALRSGEYPKTVGMLRDHKGWCCLGVLTKLAIDASPNVAACVRVVEGDEPHVELLDDENEWGIPGSEDLPEVVREWAGLDAHNPKVTFDEESLPISHVNDGFISGSERRAQPFAVIADLIEKQL